MLVGVVGFGDGWPLRSEDDGRLEQSLTGAEEQRELSLQTFVSYDGQSSPTMAGVNRAEQPPLRYVCVPLHQTTFAPSSFEEHKSRPKPPDWRNNEGPFVTFAELELGAGGKFRWRHVKSVKSFPG